MPLRCMMCGCEEVPKDTAICPKCGYYDYGWILEQKANKCFQEGKGREGQRLMAVSMNHDIFKRDIERQEKRLKSGHSDTSLFLGLGRAYCQIGDNYKTAGMLDESNKSFARAIEIYVIALDKFPNDGVLLAGLGQVFYIIGDRNKAKEYYRRAASQGYQDAIMYCQEKGW